VTLLNDTAAYTLVGTGVTAALAYLSNRFASRRASVADTLVAALRDAQRSQFLLDLRSPDHVRLISKPLAAWTAASYVRREGVASPSADDCLKKFDEILSWRVEEREARIRFAIVARSHDIRRFADFHCAVYGGAVNSKQKTLGLLPADYAQSVDELIRTIISVRVPSVLRPFNLVARRVPGIRRLLVDDDDIRMLVADYSRHFPDGAKTPSAH
jgi:hypothetical protein